MVTTIDLDGELRFRGLWNRIGADSTPDVEYKRLLETYLEHHRNYHSIKHIVNSLDELEKAKHLMDNPNQVEFALWYHDRIMKKMSRVDEERSVEMAFKVCKNAELSDQFIEKVKNLILITKHHGTPTTKDEKFMADIDLAILGKSPEEFDKYEEAIKKEFSWVDPEIYRVNRIAVLERFLDKEYGEHIYHTDFFRQKYEDRAKRNLERLINKLKEN
jgi:predicted metal-dependent HD superfamily phosphohydrolase